MCVCVCMYWFSFNSLLCPTMMLLASMELSACTKTGITVDSGCVQSSFLTSFLHQRFFFQWHEKAHNHTTVRNTIYICVCVHTCMLRGCTSYSRIHLANHKWKTTYVILRSMHQILISPSNVSKAKSINMATSNQTEKSQLLKRDQMNKRITDSFMLTSQSSSL